MNLVIDFMKSIFQGIMQKEKFRFIACSMQHETLFSVENDENFMACTKTQIIHLKWENHKKNVECDFLLKHISTSSMTESSEN